MQFKQKLIYFALGCAFVVIGQVLVTVLTPKVTAQGKKASAEFDTVTCRSLKVMDTKGKVRVKLEVKDPDLYPDVIQVFNWVGKPIFKVGMMSTGGSVSVAGHDGRTRAEMAVYDYTGSLMVMGKDGSIRAHIGADVDADVGTVDVYNNRVNLRAKMWADANGGRADFLGNDGKSRVMALVNKYGHGLVATWDKDGVLSGILPGVPSTKSTPSISTPRSPSSTRRGGGKYSGVSGGHWVSKVIESGKYVILEDNSLWQVSPLDKINSMLWLVTEKITVVENKDGVYLLSYPYKLINSDSKNAVEARYLGESK